MKLQFLGKSHETADVWTYSFRAPEGATWLAGQSVRLELPVGYDIEEKRFTISSAPFEKRIDITTRLSGSKFKNSLNALTEGQAIDGQSIEGDFTWIQDDRAKLFVASGIGITPFRSILRQLEQDEGSLKAALVYAGREDELPFEYWLRQLAANYPDFRLQLIHGRRLTAMDIEPRPDSLIYLSGPSDMVNRLGDQLIAAGVPRQNLKRDLFTGRPGWSEV
ncbi:MAG TPA: FAD-dependent oxidoreductase [Candidatus Saccharimonadales bacterium]|nr:FAD-dependent oxidoreductase [Candidatus Saccharimonadales bacterium]